MGVVNSWILFICIIFMQQIKFPRCLSVHHLAKHKRFISSKSQVPGIKIGNKNTTKFFTSYF